MKIIFHTGAHCTDEDRILKCLLRNKEAFSQNGVAVPGPGKYRQLLKDTFNALEVGPAAEGARDVLIDAILDDEVAGRLILSNEHFFGSQRHVLDHGQLYPEASDRVAKMRELFPQDQIEIYMAVRNPATFLPAALQKATGQRIAETLSRHDPRALLWSDMFQRIQDEVPGIKITVWCNEDLPLIWGEVVRRLAGLPMDEKIAGGFDLLSEIMSKEGMQRFRVYLHQNPELTEAQRRRVMIAFLDKYAIEDEIVEELDLPGWSDDLVEEMTAIYEADIDTIADIPGVRVILP
ncbi:hypothetical protein [Antarcticimicrobium luteum]|uniref:Sulfotransferase family protein n=1 Tax=Antarcticimicrobium luteum TaxID=2547397 RepID=A0A4V3AQ34_9RHOB|nr:hypothetical protein [Antarcticimicrobium luteum]TDK41207.1 hypothetical protein E1832_21190 [Antarcticimicrobium luteum]